jgi:hypothetical protein
MVKMKPETEYRFECIRPPYRVQGRFRNDAGAHRAAVGILERTDLRYLAVWRLVWASWSIVKIAEPRRRKRAA